VARKDPAAKTAGPLRLTFDSAADLYDAARPSYPQELFDDLVTLARLQPGSRLLVIGCATGKATRDAEQRPGRTRRVTHTVTLAWPYEIASEREFAPLPGGC
jgi:hypothetical protein